MAKPPSEAEKSRYSRRTIPEQPKAAQQGRQGRSMRIPTERQRWQIYMI